MHRFSLLHCDRQRYRGVWYDDSLYTKSNNPIRPRYHSKQTTFEIDLEELRETAIRTFREVSNSSDEMWETALTHRQGEYTEEIRVYFYKPQLHLGFRKSFQWWLFPNVLRCMHQPVKLSNLLLGHLHKIQPEVQLATLHSIHTPSQIRLDPTSSL